MRRDMALTPSPRSPTAAVRRERAALRQILPITPSPRENARARADLRQDADGQDHHAGRRAVGHDRQRQTKNPGQGGHPARPAAPHLRGQAARGRADAVRLQYPEREHDTFGTETARRHVNDSVRAK